MQKPSGYDEAHAGEFIPVELGGHYAIVKKVAEQTSSTGKDMIVVLIDFDRNDKQPRYFSDLYAREPKEDRRWPFNGRKYIMVMDYSDPNKTSRAFKTFCTSVEDSNGMTITWGGSDWGLQFIDKRIGVVYGEEEHEFEGKTSMRRVIKYFCPVDAVASQKIPKPKYLTANNAASSREDTLDEIRL